MKQLTALAVCLAASAACGTDKFGGPSGPVEAIEMAFCDIFRPTWMAIQNEGDVWKQVTLPASGPISIEATSNVSVAMVFSLFGNSTVILNMSRDELVGTPSELATDCGDQTIGDRELRGTVSGIAASDVAYISAGLELVSAGTNYPDWTLSYLPNSPVDLVASRIPTQFDAPPDRVIVRRSETPQISGGPALPALDFSGSESQALESATLTLTGVGSDFVSVSSMLMTATGTFHDFTYLTSFDGANTFNYVSLPAGLRTATDLHGLEVMASTATGTRGVTHFYKTPGAKTFALGPMVSVPAISTVATSPARRMQAMIAGQAAYPTAASAIFLQFLDCGTDCFDFRIVEVLTSAAFLGGPPTTWDLTIPDLSPAGYQTEWGLENGTAVDWEVAAYNGSSSGVLGGTPQDGTTLYTSGRTSEGVNARLARIGRDKRTYPGYLGTLITRRRR